MPHNTFTAVAIAVLAFAAASPAMAQTDDVIVDGRIITGENPAAAAPKPFDPQFSGGVFVGGDDKGTPGGLKGKAAKTNANATPYRGAGKIAGAGTQANAGEQPPPPPPPPPPSNGGASPLPVLLVIADRQDFFYAKDGLGLTTDPSTPKTKDQPAGGGAAVPKTGSLGSLNSVGSIGQLAAPPGAPPAQAQNNIKQLGLAAHNYDSSGGDVNGDGVKDVITSTGPGGGPHVKAFDGNANAGPKGATHVKVFDGTRATGPKVGGAPQVKADGNANAASVGGVVKGFTLSTKGTK